jgi:protein-tyrosine phosphatase
MMMHNGRLGFVPDCFRCPAAWFYPRILVGPGAFLTQRFVAEQNITHVINCADDGACPEWFSDRYPEKYVCIDGIDSIYVNILDWYPKFEAKLHQFLRAGTGVVYVHCQAGMNRSGSLALAYVCKNFHLPLDEVVVATRKQRPVLFQNAVFMNQVKEFINGCISGAENQRLVDIRLDDGDAGLSASDDHPGLEGLIVDARESEDRTGGTAIDDFGPLFEERPGFGGEGEPVGSSCSED